MKPYQQIPICECGEPLVPIPLEQFAVEQPHPYVKVGAPYGNKSPYYLRQGVLQCLMQAQQLLQQRCPHWRIQIFDAYRPLAVQQYMVDYSFAQVVAAQGLSPEQLTEPQRDALWSEVYQFWAVPSYDPATPPPHSTGAAVDVTLVDAIGSVVNMGSPIDEMSPRSYPDYFAGANPDYLAGANPDYLAGANPDYLAGANPDYLAEANGIDAEGDRLNFHAHRQVLKWAMSEAGFRQHPREWWHFSLGDQLWSWLLNQDNPHVKPIARYGAV